MIIRKDEYEYGNGTFHFDKIYCSRDSAYPDDSVNEINMSESLMYIKMSNFN